MSEAQVAALAAEGTAAAASANANKEQTGQPTGPAWLPGADADTAAFVQAKGWQDPAAAVTSYRNLEKLWGADKAGHTVQIPGETADQKTKDTFYNRLGRPETVDKYSVKAKDFAGIPENSASALINLAHAEGLTDKQLKAVQNWNNVEGKAFEAKLQQDAMIEVSTQQAALKAEWGAAHDQNTQVAKEAASKLGWTKEQIDAMQLGIGFDGVMKMMHKLGEQVGEGKFIQGEGGRSAGGGSGKMTPAQARTELIKLASDPVFQKEWMDKTHPNHAAAINKKSQLSAWSIGAE